MGYTSGVSDLNFINAKKVNKENYINFLDPASTDLDSNASDTWYLQGNYDTAATAISPEQLEALQNGGITNYNISDPSINSEKTYSFNEAMGKVSTDDIETDYNKIADANNGLESASAVTSGVGSALMTLGGALALTGNPILGIGGTVIGGLSSLAGGLTSKGASQREASATAEAQKQATKAIEDRQQAVKDAWIADVLDGKNDDYYITDVKKDEEGHYIDGTIRAKQKQVVLTGYGDRGIRSSGIGM